MKINFFDTARTARSGSERRKALRKASEAEHSAGFSSFGYDYFDNPDLGIGYGGYKYDGRFADTVRNIITHYRLRPGDKVLELGCAKGYLLVEFLKQGMQVTGIDGSEYALRFAHPDVRDHLRIGDIRSLPFPDKFFDLVIAKDILEHNPESAVRSAITECMRVSKGPVFFQLCVGRTPEEVDSMPKWDTTYVLNRTPEWWDLFFEGMGFHGDLHYKVLVPVEEHVS